MREIEFFLRKGYPFPMLAMKVLSSVTYYNGTSHFAKENKEKTSVVYLLSKPFFEIH